MLANPPDVRPVICECADLSSDVDVATVTVDLGPGGIVVTEKVVVSKGTKGTMISGVGIIPIAPQRKPPTKTFAVIRGRRPLCLLTEPDNEPRTRVAERGPSLSLPRRSFKIK